MRHRAKVDANQEAIVAALRAYGASVCSLAGMADGCPDIIAGFRGTNFLFEIKDGSKPPSRRKLTPDQERWHAAWEGSVHIVENEEQALDVIKP